MILLLDKIISDVWTKTTWQEYIEAIADPSFVKAKSYYFQSQMRIEDMPVSSAHASIHATILIAVSLFATFHQISFLVLDKCSFRKIGFAECQPDIAYYLGDSQGDAFRRAQSVPIDTGIIDLEIYPVPDLVIEIALTSLSDDKGEKRLLYESLGVENIGL